MPFQEILEELRSSKKDSLDWAAEHWDGGAVSIKFISWLAEQQFTDPAEQQDVDMLAVKLLQIREFKEAMYLQQDGQLPAAAPQLPEGSQLPDAQLVLQAADATTAFTNLARKSYLAAVELDRDMEEVKTMSTASLLGRVQLSSEDMNELVNAVSVEERILDYLLSVDDEAERNAQLEDAFTPPEKEENLDPVEIATNGDDLMEDEEAVHTTPMRFLQYIDLVIKRNLETGNAQSDLAVLQQLRIEVAERVL
ncbi:hypothetical protein CYMTET_11811 [Cymbomonas tetramitiformis]|uniref:Uncharacterized protein n=1 Tax=Cymbomonas tetramitiformis TaxID=36881 RepID=A0AAE0GLA9_9CHLO|nr:hypothetical protein CYMTET_11811 [Cymbomonas tetramitiformis]